VRHSLGSSEYQALLRWHAPCEIKGMNLADIFSCRQDFLILQTTPLTQTAVMRLLRGESSADVPETHPNSDQVVLVLEGDMIAEIGGEERALSPGASLVIPAGTPHRLRNTGQRSVFAYTTYSPPAYPADFQAN
jgi:mannose-6-phosphate isomerase-like protein (cupin superfamily)